jgi:hypothetical protein
VDERYEKEDEWRQGEVTWWKGNTGERTDSGKAKGNQKSEEENKEEVHSCNADDDEFLYQLCRPDETLEIDEATQFLHALRQGVPPAASASSSSSNSGQGGYSPKPLSGTPTIPGDQFATLVELIRSEELMPQLPSELQSRRPTDPPLLEAPLYNDQAPFSSIAPQKSELAKHVLSRRAH